MSIYKSSSLAMIPTAYKDGKLYSIRPIPEYGSELVTNGTFATDSDWTKETGWTISGGKASYNGSAATNALFQNISATSGTKYRVSFSVVNYVSGSFKAHLSNGSATGASPLITANGDYVFDITATGGLLLFRNVTSFNGSIDNVSVQEIVSSGDFTFSRGSNLAATRVDVNGLIEKGRENLVLQSNQFDTTWVLTNAPTLTSGQAGYDGSNDAWKLEASTTGSSRSIHQVVSSSGVQVFSVYVKAGTTDWIRLNLSGVGNRYFDIGNGVVGGSGSMDGFITDVGGGWYRCSVLGNGSSTAPYVFLASDNGNLSVNAGDNIYIQDAQLEQGLVATDYIETTTTSVSAGILEDMPRLDYSGGASCPSLKLEPQRSNVVTQSEYFGDSSWNNSNAVTRSISSTSSPEGKLNAYDIIPTTANTNHTLRAPNLSGFTSGAVVNVSFFAKANGYKFISVVGGFGSSSTPAVVFNLDEGAIESGTGTIEDYGSGWYRCVSPITLNATALYCVGTILNDSQSGSFAGDGTSAISVYGFQIEEASYPTSYIPCMGTSQTRSGDACLATSVSDLIGQTQGTLFAEFEMGVDNAHFFLYTNTSNAIYIQTRIGDMWRAYVIKDGVYQVTITLGSVPTSGFVKMAFAYNENDFALYANGNLIGSDTSGSVPTCDSFDFGLGPYGAGYGAKRTKQTILFPTRLTNAELAALTTL